MQVKTFCGPSTREVLSRIKAELGKDAIILDSQTVKENGQTRCQVTAAIDPQQEPATDPVSPAFPGWSEWQRDWAHFKENVFSLIRPHMERDQLNGRQRLILDNLEGEGVNAQVLLKLWQGFREQPDIPPLQQLFKLVATRPWGQESWPLRYHALAGPHGVGKTTTCLRLALHCKRELPQARICLINADLHQGKGRLFLQHYAELSGIEYLEAASPRDWALAARHCASHDKVFIDLPGMSAGLPLDGWLKQRGCTVLKDLCVHLVLSPLFSEKQLEAYLKAYATKALSSLVWTKIDEACTFGSMVNATHDTGLPVSLLSSGPSLKDSLFPAKDRMLWELVFRHRLPVLHRGESRDWSVSAPVEHQPRKVQVS